MLLKSGHILGLSILLSIVAAPLALAESAATPPAAGSEQLTADQQQMVMQFQQHQQKMQQLQQQLGEIQQAAMKKNPKLEEQQEDYRQLVLKTMRDNGAKPEQKIEKLESLQAKVQDDSLSEDKRRAAYMEFQQENQSFTQAQRQAMQSSKVQEAQQNLNQAILTAMIDHNPQTEGLIMQMQQAQQQMMQIRQRAMSSVAPTGGGHP
jgi:hypothetical protein